MSAPCAVLVFAKAPVPGYAKTRLAPALGDAGAARLAERLLAHAMDAACAANIGPVELCCAPGVNHPVFARLAQRDGVRLVEQGPGDLGERMAHAFDRVLRAVPRAVLIGTDAPGLDAACLRAARDALADHDAVFAPALDGGYALVGLATPASSLFSDMAWSTPQVMDATRQRLARLGLRHHELPALADIDEPADLVHLPAGWLDRPLA